MDKFVDLLSRYARAWAAICQHVQSGDKVAAIAAARECISLSYQLDACSGLHLPETLSQSWAEDTIREVKRPDGILVEKYWVAWPFSPEEIGLDPVFRYED